MIEPKTNAEILVHLVRPGVGADVYRLPEGATLADLLRRAEASTGNQSVFVDGVMSKESLVLHDGAIVIIVPSPRNARLMPDHPTAEPPTERNPIERLPVKQTRPKARTQLLNWRTFDPSSINSDDSLAVEVLTYKNRIKELLKFKGKYVIIKGSEVIGFFDTLDDALEAAADRFGGDPALIKQVVEREPIHPAGGLAL